MRPHRLSPAALAGLLLAASLGRADATRPAPPSPLRLMPAEADFVLQLHQPRRLLERAEKLGAVEKLLALPAVKEQLAGTGPRRFRQLVAYFETQLGAAYPELLDDLAGGGVALAGKIAPNNNGPVLLVLQGKDKKRVEKFLDQAMTVLESELKRQGSKEKVGRETMEGVPSYRVGPFLIARAGVALLASNRREALAKALRLHSGKEKKSLAEHPGLVEARKSLPAGALASAWVNMKTVQAGPEGKALYASPRDNFFLTVVAGGLLDVLGRTPYACAALTLEGDTVALTVRAPRGRDGAGADRLLHVNPAGQPGSRPLLKPTGVLSSSSFYLDLGSLWKEREKLLPKEQVKGLEQADKNSLIPFGGFRLGQVLEAAAPYHRVVVTTARKSSYKTQPVSGFTSFALVTEMADADRFAKAVSTALRLAGLATTAQFRLHLVEEKRGDYKLVGYRFDEKATLANDADNVRFNFSPCFARVGNQFLFCSTIELGRELVDLLAAEQKSPGKSAPQAFRDRFFAAGFARLLEKNIDALVTGAILDRAVSPAEAKRQVREVIDLVGSLGSAGIEGLYGAKEYRLDLTVRLKKGTAEARR